jgi:DNA-directed RNA polymerase specialized sigma subunit
LAEKLGTQFNSTFYVLKNTGGIYMKNYDNQSDERTIFLRDLNQWVKVSKAEFDVYFRDINAYRKKQQQHGRCVCPAKKRHLCNMDCWTCPYRRAGDQLSLDYSTEDDEGHKKSWLDDLEDMTPGPEQILEEKDLLVALLSKVEELDSDRRAIIKLLLQNKTEREIASIMGISKQSTINYKKHKAFENLWEHLKDYI